MGACCSVPLPVAPKDERERTPPLSSASSATASRRPSGEAPPPGDGTQGHHWAESSPVRTKRAALAPWQGGGGVDASGDDVTCGECEPAQEGFDFRRSFPLYVMKMDTFMALETMRMHEDMVAEGLVFEWEPSMGRLWFMSHQWTSFNHPDAASEQLVTAQGVIRTIRAGRLRDVFATEEEFQAYVSKESNRFLNFPVVTAEGMAEDARDGFVWLDYSSVPQAHDAEEARARAIDSIPYYVDHARVFMALVPRVEHKDLPGTFCDYKSWTERGWCRLETQVHELRLFESIPGELMPGTGVGAIDIPHRPLIVHSPQYCTTYDMFDNFYMIWQRKNSVFCGEFACCRLGHKRPTGAAAHGGRFGARGADDDAEETIVCDKVRIRPLVRGLWDRKVAHLKQAHPLMQLGFLWRWASHVEIMMAERPEDDGNADDAALDSLAAILAKYHNGTPDVPDAAYFRTLEMWLKMIAAMFGAHPSFASDAPAVRWRGGPGGKDAFEGPELKVVFDAWVANWLALSVRGQALQVAVMYMVAEGNLAMLAMLHEQHGASLSLGYFWGITLLDFAAGKGHVRVMRYLLQHGAPGTVNKPSFRERITATDRACKAGFVDALELLHEHGADLDCRRLNGQVPAHGAAMWGHLAVLRRLHELGADVLTPVDDALMAPLDYALYYNQMPCADYLRSLGGEGYLSLKERAAAEQAAELAAGRLLQLAKIQARQRGRAARRQLQVLQRLDYVERHASGLDGLGFLAVAPSPA